jgi:hypothetical protein
MEMPNSKKHVELPVTLDVADLVIQPRAKDFPSSTGGAARRRGLLQDWHV